MPETSTRYAVACAACGLRLVATARVTDPEIAALEAHLRVCRASLPLPDASHLGVILRGVLVTVITDVEAQA